MPPEQHPATPTLAQARRPAEALDVALSIPERHGNAKQEVSKATLRLHRQQVEICRDPEFRTFRSWQRHEDSRLR